MRIQLNNAGKRFNRDWIFSGLDYTFESGTAYAVIGMNGSGKSTLLQILGGAVDLNAGKCRWIYNGTPIVREKVFEYIAICAPSLELIEEMTLLEFLQFHHSFKSFVNNIGIKQIIEEIGLQQAANKRIKDFSSGMKQRVKLAQCIFSNVPVMILDEPCTNLDRQGVELYYRLINHYCTEKLILIGSNDETEYKYCNASLNLMDYKQRTV